MTPPHLGPEPLDRTPTLMRESLHGNHPKPTSLPDSGPKHSLTTQTLLVFVKPGK